ncbi:glycosyltransferase family 4 protein [Fibrobacter sp. HC4]|uniref:glycosyltransferase family 4 protein n=1 Tax=Fibrobacter sp. HC4 TaxID=3239812 RepID=UPI0020187244|nr:glycosyltransferase family 4 protein [Fibrobacter succinogenes]
MKILYVTTISNTMTFFIEHIKMLLNEGHSVELACSSALKPVNPIYNELGCKIHEIPFSRSPFSKNNIAAYKKLKRLVESEGYDIVHCHTPNAAMITRLACRKVRKQGTKVFYTAHGFHFFKGAPLKNWLMFYPVEKICARWTDVLITINHEDYEFAKKNMPAKKVCHVPGVGLNLDKFRNVKCDRNETRSLLGMPLDCFLLLSVGELNANKNHQTVIRAMACMKQKNVHYMIAGVGCLKENLHRLAVNLGIGEKVHFLGYRNDIPDLAYASDVFCFMSRREGLGMAALEAMACGLPLISSNVHGINDYSENGVTGYKCAPCDVNKVCEYLDVLSENSELKKKIGEGNKRIVERFSSDNVVAEMRRLYE